VLSKRFHSPMHSKINIWPLFFLLAISACASGPGAKPAAVQPSDAEQAIFQQGEDLLNKGAADEALARYSLYLGRSPRGRHAAEAMQRIGTIYQQKGTLDAAQAFYQSAIDQFPDSQAAVEARLSLMDILIQQHHSAEAADMAARMLAGPLDQKVRQTLWRRLAQLYQNSDNPVHSVYYAYLLFKELPPPEKDQWGSQIKETISRLNGGDIKALWDRIDDRQIRGYLMHRYAVIQVMQEHYADALELLNAFQFAYPGNPYEADTRNLIQELSQKLAFTPYTLGCLLPLSGSYQAYGQRVLNAVELALSRYQVGETPAPFKLVIEDSGSDDAQAVQAVRKLAQARVGAILGPINAAPAAAQEAQRLNIPILTFTQKTDITSIGDFVFRNFITPQSQVRTLVDYFINDLGVRKFAVMYPEEIYGKTFMNLFWDEVVRQGGRMVGVEAYAPGQTDFAETIKKLVGLYYPVPADLQAEPVVRVEENPYFQNAPGPVDRLETWVPDPVARLSGLFYQDPDQDRIKGPAMGRSPAEKAAQPIVDFDVLFIPDAPNEAGLILPQLAYHDIKNIYMVGTNLWHSQQLIEMAKQYAQNAVLVDGFDTDSASKAVRNFVETYRSVYNTEPRLMEAFAFDTANMLFTLLSRPDIHLRSELRDYLKQMIQTEGATGSTAFESNGEAVKKLNLLRIKGDQFIEIHP
jgi:ABC-type branched-subunit amino acid transport system substrate-binding protein/outer membrane protein assembly factor BamD (BamD/ComL family)